MVIVFTSEGEYIVVVTREGDRGTPLLGCSYCKPKAGVVNRLVAKVKGGNTWCLADKTQKDLKLAVTTRHMYSP